MVVPYINIYLSSSHYSSLAPFFEMLMMIYDDCLEVLSAWIKHTMYNNNYAYFCLHYDHILCI